MVINKKRSAMDPKELGPGYVIGGFIVELNGDERFNVGHGASRMNLVFGHWERNEKQGGGSRGFRRGGSV
ncbi:hypothetical protein HanRHA438_Chr15g0685481 [Helianthus annuus]|nr:hypothetical protein HanRHA438_Chr15g0685481 [Helianthus annuus]